MSFQNPFLVSWEIAGMKNVTKKCPCHGYSSESLQPVLEQQFL